MHIMKRVFYHFTAMALLGAALAAIPAVSRAAESSTNATPAATQAPGPLKFYGAITALDTNAMTFTVGEQTFTITAESAITKDGKKASLTDAVVGEPARGTYTKTASGKLDVTKVRFGKKTGGKGGGKKNKDAASADGGTAAPPAKSGD